MITSSVQNWTRLFTDDIKLYRAVRFVVDCFSVKHNCTMTSEDGTSVQLEETVMEKDLGIVVDNKLTFNQLINCIVGSANQVTAMLRRSFKFMDK